jgi:hypothetical protein
MTVQSVLVGWVERSDTRRFSAPVQDWVFD